MMANVAPWMYNSAIGQPPGSMLSSLVAERGELRRNDWRAAQRAKIEAEVDALRGQPRSESGRRAVISSAYEEPSYWRNSGTQPPPMFDPYDEPPPPPWADHGEVKYWMKFGHAPRPAPFVIDSWEKQATADVVFSQMEHEIAREVAASSPRKPAPASSDAPLASSDMPPLSPNRRRIPFTEVSWAPPGTLEAGMADSGKYHVRRPGRPSLLF